MIDKAELTYSFAEFEVDAGKRLLLKNAEAVSLNPKALDLLVVLLENRGQIVTKEELLEKVWTNQFVEENNLTVHISALRKVFGEKKGAHQFIVTVPGTGYKFVADVRLPFGSSEHEISDKLSILQSSLTISAPPGIETNLIGRGREIAEIKDLLRQNDVNLVTLTGAGGSGKTSLARTVAAELKADFADGVFFVELAAATDSNLVVSAIAQTLDVTEASNKSLDETLRDFLQTRQILLVLDNFEQVLTAAPFVSELSASAESIKILVTSRAALRLPNEREISVLPLELPPVGSRPLLEQLDTYPAIALFYKRAQAVKPNFVLTDENVVPVAEICRRLDGLPLAIELAAVRVKLLSPNAILERLENSLSLLTGGATDLPSRQRTMRGAVEWSYDLLTEEEKFLFRRLAVFAGGFTVEAAEFVIEGEKRQREEIAVTENNLPISPSPHLAVSQSRRPPVSLSVLDLLDSLIKCNLLASKDQSDGNARLRMLEVVREFAMECLEESGETESVRRLHSECFLELAEKAEPLLHGESGSKWLEKLETDYDNLRSALSWTLKNDGEIAARIAAGLRFFWLNRSHLSEGLSWSEAALAATENSVSKARSDLLLSNGVFLRSQGNLEASQKVYEKTLEESRQLNDLSHIIKANHGLAAIAVLQKDFSSAQTAIEEALALSRELKDEMQTAYSLASLGDLEMSRENLLVARPLLEECLTIARKLRHTKLLSVTCFNLGTIDFFENSFEKAASNFAESLQIAGEMGNKTMISCNFEGFAALAVKNGNAAQSARLAGAAESLREAIGYYIEPAEEIFRNKYLAETRAALGEERFAALYIQGKKLNSDDATALVFQDQSSAEVDFIDENFTEIIVENHSFSRIAIEEIDDLPQHAPVIHAERRISGFENRGRIASPDSSEKRSRKILNAFAVLAILATIVIGGGYVWRQTASPFSSDKPFAKFSVRQLTTNGKVSIAALAPDGKTLAYVVSDTGQNSLWIGNVDGGNHLQLRTATAEQYINLAFSRDGNRVYFSMRGDNNPNGTLYKMPVSGGASEVVLDGVGNFVLSPDGGKIAFGKRDQDAQTDSVFIAPLSDGERQKIASFPRTASFVFDAISWSSDGKRLAVGVAENDISSRQNINIIEVSSGKIEAVKIENVREISKTAWLEGDKGLIITAVEGDSWSSIPQFRVFHVSLPSGILRKLTTDLSGYGASLSLSANYDSLLTIEHRQLNNIWIAPSDDLSRARQITFGSFGKYDGLWGTDFTPDGKIVYINSDTVSQFISQMDADGANSKPLTAAGAIDSALNVSPDGKFIVFHSSRKGGFDVWRMDADGSNAKQMTFGKKNYLPTVSADNRWIYYKSWETNTGELRRISADGGEPEILNDKETSFVSFSPDGKYFAALLKTDKWRLAIFSTETNQVLKQFDLAKNGTMLNASRWTPDSRYVAYRDRFDGYWLQPIEGGEPQKMEGLPKETLYNFAWSKDGKQFAFVRGQEIRDVVLISSEK